MLKRGGVYATAGGATARILEALLLGPVMRLLGNRKIGLLWWKPFTREDVAALSRLIDTGRIKPVIDRTFPLHEVPEALRYLDERRAAGKIVVIV